MPLRGFCCIMLAMLKKVLLLAAAAACTFAALPGCADDNQTAGLKYSRQYYAFSTLAEFNLYSAFTEQEEKDRAVALGDSVRDLLGELENTLSVAVEGSDIYKFNTAAPGATVGISQHTYNVLKAALDMYEETEGAYNAGVYYSVDLWGFAPSLPGDEPMPYDREHPNEQLPEQKYVKAFRQLGEFFPQIKLKDNGDGTYSAIKPEDAFVTVEGDETVYSLRIDLGGIGKGYAVELVDELIDEAGFENGYFSFGTSSMAINGSATSEDGKWELAFRDPRGTGDGSYLSLRTANVAVSTSGDYENYYMIEGTRYCHIIDPGTGAPIQNGIATASCVGGDAAEDDARTTAICTMTPAEAVAYINREDIKAMDLKMSFVVVSGDNKYVVTNMRPEEYTLAAGFTLASTVDEQGNVSITVQL